MNSNCFFSLQSFTAGLPRKSAGRDLAHSISVVLGASGRGDDSDVRRGVHLLRVDQLASQDFRQLGGHDRSSLLGLQLCLGEFRLMAPCFAVLGRELTRFDAVQHLDGTKSAAKHDECREPVEEDVEGENGTKGIDIILLRFVSFFVPFRFSSLCLFSIKRFCFLESFSHLEFNRFSSPCRCPIWIRRDPWAQRSSSANGRTTGSSGWVR